MGGSIAGWIWPTEGTGQIRVILQCATSVQNWARQNPPVLRLKRRRGYAAVRFSTP
jgi:hypothetical protein